MWVLALLLCSCVHVEGGADRLIKTANHTRGEWMGVETIDKLVKMRTRGGPGFMDVTNVKMATWRQHVRHYPDAPQHVVEVNRVNHLYLEPEGVQRLGDFLKPLTEFHNRYYVGEWAVASSVWIAEHAQARINAAERSSDASVSLHLNPDFDQMNVVVRLRGTSTDAQDIIILGAHMDSINADGPAEQWHLNRAPGADDNGSGSAAVMHVLESILRSGFRPERTVEFHWYAGEERGLLGARNLANQYALDGVEVYAMLNIDMCGGGGGFNFIMDYVSVPLSRFNMKLVDQYCDNPHAEAECGYACSDHAAWHDEGYPSSFPIEILGATDPDTGAPCRGHTDDDRFVCVDLELVLDFARLGAAFVVELSFV